MGAPRTPKQHRECGGGTLWWHRGHRTVPAECPCPCRAESKAAFIPLLCYGCRLTFKELVRLSVCGGAALLGDGGPQLCHLSLTGSPRHATTLCAC